MSRNTSCTLAAAVVAMNAAGGMANVDEVDPTIGNVAWMLKPTRPTVHLPNSMVRFHPYREDARSDQIDYFPLTMCAHRHGGSFSVMPGPGPLTYDHERTTPYAYSVWLEEPEATLEFAPGARCGFFRVTAEKGIPELHFSNRDEGSFRPGGRNSFSAIECCGGATKVYIFGECDLPVRFDASKGGLVVRPENAGARTIRFRYGVSYIDATQAEKNLRAELGDWDFDGQVAVARKRWEETLGRIQVKGGTAAQRRVFFTALYRSHERMVDITEDGRYWSGYDNQVHEADRPFYVDNWLWDTYLAQEPLMMILAPAMVEDQIASYILMYEQTGWMPKFSSISGPVAAMTGNHTASWMADAWSKGLRNFDMEKAYQGNRRNALQGTLIPWRSGPRTTLDEFHAAQGFFPALHPGEEETEPLVKPGERRQAVAVTLEYAYDDWNLAQTARALGHDADAGVLIKRAENYRNVYRQDKGQMWPRDARGEWIEPFDPASSGGQGARDYFTENNGYMFNWHVRHDFSGLFELMGGRRPAEEKLDELFRGNPGWLGDGSPVPPYFFFRQFPDSTGMVGRFSMGNEPGFHIPYLYDYLGTPWKAQKRIRMLLDTWFMDNVFGIPGDEDGGAISAWVVFSMLGLYPTVPGVPVYAIGCPSFEEATLLLPDGKRFTVSAPGNSSENKYIQSVTLAGEPLTRLWLRHSELMAGGTITLQMGSRPNKELGTRLEDLPPSSINLNPETLR